VLDDDPYSLLVDQTAADMVRALLVYPDGDEAGIDALRSASHLLTAQYGAAGLRDLAEVLAADMAELMTMLARVEGRAPLEVLDEWSHDEPPSTV
jgi:hypothetical protein